MIHGTNLNPNAWKTMDLKQQVKWRSAGFTVGSCIGFFLIIPEVIPMPIRLVPTVICGLVVAFPDFIRFTFGVVRSSGTVSTFRNGDGDDR